MFKFIKKILAPASTPDTAAKPGQADQAELSGDSEVTIDGAQVRLNDLVELHRQHAKTGDSLAPETQIEVDGKAVTIAEIADTLSWMRWPPAGIRGVPRRRVRRGHSRFARESWG